jgi:hypothetical protein
MYLAWIGFVLSLIVHVSDLLNLTYFFFGYAILNFVLFIMLEIGSGNSKGRGNITSSNVFRRVSALRMAFYSATMAISYSTIDVEEHDDARRCLNGHSAFP